MISVGDIRKEGEVIHGFVNDTYNNCGMLNSCLSEFLSDNNVSHRFVRTSGVVSKSGNSHPHEFLVVENGEVSGVNGELVVDVALDQFCEGRFVSGDVGVSFGNREDLPKVGLFSRSSDFSSPSIQSNPTPFEWYNWN